MSYKPADYLLKFQMPLGRTRTVLAMFCLIGLGIMGRVLYLQTTKADFLEKQGDARFTRTVDLPYLRGQIMDRNGLPLAVSLFDFTISANPEQAVLTARETERLAGLLSIPVPTLGAKLAENKQLTLLKRRVDPETAASLKEMRLPGILVKRELHRSYSQDAAFSQVVGFTDVEDKGQEGVELAFNEQLMGKSGRHTVTKDLKGRIVSEPAEVTHAQNGKDVTLALDARLQNVVFEELMKVNAKFKAKSSGAVLIDTQTGEILAMGSVPAYDPTKGTGDKNLVKNRPVTDLFEPGSTLKPFTMAAAVESGHVKYDTLIETGDGRITIGNHTITDTHPGGTLTAWQVIQKSSNVGMTKITLGMNGEIVEKTLHGSGFGFKPGIGLPGEASGKLRPAKTWKPIEQATISFGNGVSVSLLQLVHGYTVFARDGTIQPLSLLKLDKPAEGKRVVSKATAETMRKMLRSVAEEGGTGKSARIPGYTIAGKTGTAHKVVGRTYGRSYVASFVGMAPATNPRFVLGVMVDEPHGAHYGGEVSAPTWSAIAAKALALLEVPQDDLEPHPEEKKAPGAVEARD